MNMSAKQIKFGTDGWRGVIDQDFNDENVQIISLALADYVRGLNTEGGPVIVGYDRRAKSDHFAQVAADTLMRAGIPVLLSDSACSSPTVSMAVVANDSPGGVMITASHNPPQFNGYKFKASFGGSAGPEITTSIEGFLQAAEEKLANLPPRTRPIPKVDIVEPFLTAITKLVDIGSILSLPGAVVTDVMHGSGAGYFHKLFIGSKFQHIAIREEHDTNFGGVNPEPLERNMAACMEAVKKAGAICGFSVDGDADRIGAVDETGRFIDSHTIFALLLIHLVERRKLTGRVVKTISTSRWIDVLCKQFDLPLTVTPIGFKYICDNMLQGDVLIGGEESGGIGVKGHIPERDGVLMALLLMEAMAYSKMSLSDMVEDLYRRAGERHYHRIDLHLTPEQISTAREHVKAAQPQSIAGEMVLKINRADGTKLELQSGSWLLLRASGTEPVVRIYAEAATMPRVMELLHAGEELCNGHIIY